LGLQPFWLQAFLAAVSLCVNRQAVEKTCTFNPTELSQRNFSSIQRRVVMSKAQDTRKETKKKPAQSPKEKRKAKQEKKKDN